MRVRCLLLILMLANALPCAAAELSPTVRLSIPRKVGYVVGDLIQYDALLDVDPSWRLRASSLPTPGLSQYWLELRKVDVEESRDAAMRSYRVHLVYQTFYAPIEARTRALPELSLEFERPGGSTVLPIPSLTITMSPLREVSTGTGDPEQNVALEPDRAPQQRSLRAPALGAAAGLVFSLCLYLAAAWQRAAWPFSRQPRRPFARLARTVRAQNSREYGDVLLAIHRAFDAAAGWRVFADDRARFLAQHPAFGGAAPEIESFFEASRHHFFGDDAAPGAVELSPDELRGFIFHMAALETGA